MIHVIADRRAITKSFPDGLEKLHLKIGRRCSFAVLRSQKYISSNDSILAAKHVELIEKAELSNAAVAIGIDAETLLERDRFSFAMSAPRW